MKYLIQFSQQHESFWLPELDSMLELNGVDAEQAYNHNLAWAVVSKGHKVIDYVILNRSLLAWCARVEQGKVCIAVR